MGGVGGVYTPDRDDHHLPSQNKNKIRTNKKQNKTNARTALRRRRRGRGQVGAEQLEAGGGAGGELQLEGLWGGLGQLFFIGVLVWLVCGGGPCMGQ